MTQHFFMLGLSHKTVALRVRELFSMYGEEPGSLFACLTEGSEAERPAVDEVVVLSTCNRFEVYCVGPSVEACRRSVKKWFFEAGGAIADPDDGVLYSRVDGEAVKHLMEVAAGLDSLVVGETEVLGQVVAAQQAAQQVGASGPVLNALFRYAIQAGKRARAETGISQDSTSVPGVAARLVIDYLRRKRQGRVLVVGAGNIAEMALSRLTKEKGLDVVVVNRTVARAQTLARVYGACARPLAELEAAAGETDAIISATAAPCIVLSRQSVAMIMERRCYAPLYIVDIAVPRDVEPSAAEVQGVTLSDVDDLWYSVHENTVARAAEIPKVQRIISEEQAAFTSWFRERQVAPTISQLRQHAERIKAREVRKTLQRMGNLDRSQQAAVEAMARAIINKLLHEPTVRLKDYALQEHHESYEKSLRELFNLE